MTDKNELILIDGTSDFGEGNGDYTSCDQKMDLTNAYRVVEELEDWKERQQNYFRQVLISKEKKHLAFLSEEWEKRKKVLQGQLEQSIDKCDALAGQLQQAHQEAIAAEIASRQTERKLMSELSEVERLYGAKLVALKEASRRVEEDLNHKVKLIDIDKNLLEDRLEVLKKDNADLTQQYEQLGNKIAEVKKNSLKKDQVRSLLKQLRSCEDKLNSVIESKEYFKDEWAKAARKVHHYKTEHHENLRNRIKMYKNQIDNVNGGDLSGILQQLKKRIMNVDVEEDAMSEPILTQRSQPNLGEEINSIRFNSFSYSNFTTNSARHSSSGHDFAADLKRLSASRTFSSSSTSTSSSRSTNIFSTFDMPLMSDVNWSSNPLHNHTQSEHSLHAISQGQFKFKNHFSDNDILK